MNVIMYGTDICPDCVEAKNIFSQHPEIEVDFRNITESTSTLKEFLRYRDSKKCFDSVKEAGNIGIPFFILEDGSSTFDVSILVEQEEKQGSSCSVNGCGC